MKNTMKYIVALAAVLALASCQKFLNRPTEDNYNVDNFYKTDLKLEQGVK